MNEVMKCLTERRCIRKFLSRQVEQEALREVVTAGLYAPSGMNRQAAIMLIVQDEEIIKKLSELNAEVMGAKTDPFFGAPTLIVVLADKNVRTYIEDGSLVIGSMMNAAHSLGLASCWVHRAKEVMDTEYGRELLRSKGIGDEYVGIGNLALGYADGAPPEAKPRRDNRVFSI